MDQRQDGAGRREGRSAQREASRALAPALVTAARMRGRHNFAAWWNGKKWRVLAMPGRPGISGLSCARVASCMAVDSPFTDSSGRTFRGLAARWNGRTWRLTRTRGLGFSDVSCPAPRRRVAVGQAGLLTLIERWNGTRWRSAFQVNIPVSTESRLLGPEESLLAVFKWKLDQLPATNRWHPVLTRYVEEVSGRVAGFGGNPQGIKPSPTGYPVPGQKPGGGEPEDTIESVGKISGLIFGRLGDLAGFTLETERGDDRRYHATEDLIEDLVRRAWLDRYMVVVAADTDEREVPTSIVLRRAPRDRD